MDESPGFVRATPAAEASEQLSAAGGSDLIHEVGDWLSREGRFAADNDQLIAGFCDRLLGHDVPVASARLIFTCSMRSCRSTRPSSKPRPCGASPRTC